MHLQIILYLIACKTLPQHFIVHYLWSIIVFGPYQPLFRHLALVHILLLIGPFKLNGKSEIGNFQLEISID
jgi:hypothetical protein